VWASVTADDELDAALRGLPGELERTISQAGAWADELGGLECETAVAFGSGPGWAAALEAALLLKEVALVPAEGVETREGATSAMMALGPGALALSLPAGVGDDPLLAEADEICAGQGARVMRAPGGETTDRRLAAVSTFPAAAALAARIGLERGLDVDRPAWTDAYYRVARGTA
jgi:fructoselysine-6-P-deglycase FrlB-like protein